jgi:hypothetical protein
MSCPDLNHVGIFDEACDIETAMRRESLNWQAGLKK